MKKFILSLGLILVASTLQASGPTPGGTGSGPACSLSLDGPGTINVTSVYESSLSADAEVVYNFTVKNTGNQACKFAVTFSGGESRDALKRFLTLPGAPASVSPSPEKGGTSLSYTVVTTSGQVLTDPTTPGFSGSNAVGGLVPAGSEVQQTIKFRIPQGQFVPYSQHFYRDQLRLALYNLATNEVSAASQVIAYEDLTVEAKVRPEVRLFLGEVGERTTLKSVRDYHRLNFDELTSHKSKQMSLNVISNDGYKVTFNSENGGRLKRLQAPDAFIPYTLTVNSAPYSLEGAAAQSTERADTITENGGTLVLPNTPASVFLLQFTVGATEKALAGDYKDVVWVTVRSAS